MRQAGQRATEPFFATRRRTGNLFLRILLFEPDFPWSGINGVKGLPLRSNAASRGGPYSVRHRNWKNVTRKSNFFPFVHRKTSGNCLTKRTGAAILADNGAVFGCL